MEFVLVPGAWAGAWLWEEVAKELRRKGHSAHPITLSGLDVSSTAGEVSLETHIEDVRSYIVTNGLSSVVLVGHSYSGIVVGQVASQFRDLIRHTIFVEAFLPVSGQSLLDVSGLDVAEEAAAIANNSGSWPPPSASELASQPLLTDSQVRLLSEQQRPHPGKTVTDPAQLSVPLREISASFIAHNGWLSGSTEYGLVQELRPCENWAFYVIDGGHWPMLTVPQELAAVCHSCVASEAG